VLWRQFYEFFAGLGLERGRFIGITVNSLAIALNGVVAVKIAREAFGSDIRRLRRLPYLVATCGTLALFGSIHLRDALVALTISTFAYFWVRYLARADSMSLVLVVAATGTSLLLLPLLRTEFLFVPVALTIAAAAAILLFDPKENGRRTLVLGLIGVGVLALFNLIIVYSGELWFLVSGGISNYGRTAALESTSGSLGYALILSAPYPLRVVLGSVYLYVFPIPVWTGFQLTSAYYLFTSLTALYFYITLPLALVAFTRVFGNAALRTPPLTFLAFCVVGFTVAIASTSVETRHLGAFLICFQVLALVPDLRVHNDRALYVRLAQLLVGAAVVGHAAWAVLKAF
jgi:hypothetical protein